MNTLYVKIRTGFYTHKKTAILKLLIGNDAYWVPPRIWAYCAENQPDGNLSGYPPELIASLIGYQGDATSMHQALIKSGYLDACGMVHDWEEHNGYHVTFSVRAKAAAAARWSKKKEAKKKGEETIDNRDKHCLSDASSIKSESQSSAGATYEAESIYNVYPRRVGKPAAIKAIVKAIAEFGFEHVYRATKSYSKARNGADMKFTPHPATWFNQQRFNDDPATWVDVVKKYNGPNI